MSRVSTLEVMVQQSLQDFDGIDALADLTLSAGEVATTGLSGGGSALAGTSANFEKADP